MTATATVVEAEQAGDLLARLHANISRYIRGKNDVIEQVLICLAAGGHLLIEDLPGQGKTTLAYCLARSLDCSFSRIQFTSDLLPGDVIGVSIYDEQKRAFAFHRGPLFANIVLADEINRTTPKTQSSLLEVMDRGKVSVDGNTYEVGSPFMVFATQNPVDYEGTFPLPESQMDRFLMRLQMGYPGFDDEMAILRQYDRNRAYDSIDAEPVVRGSDIMRLQQQVGGIHIEPALLDYLLRIVTTTRASDDFVAGISTRGALALKLAAQARALLKGRNFVLPEDIVVMVQPVCVHRLGLRRQTSDSLEERRVVSGLLNTIVDAIPAP